MYNYICIYYNKILHKKSISDSITSNKYKYKTINIKKLAQVHIAQNLSIVVLQFFDAVLKRFIEQAISFSFYRLAFKIFIIIAQCMFKN